MKGTNVWTMNISMKSKFLAAEMDAFGRSSRRSKFERNNYIGHEINDLKTTVERIHQKDLYRMDI